MLVISGPSVILTSEDKLAKPVFGILPLNSKVTERPVLFGNLYPIFSATAEDLTTTIVIPVHPENAELLKLVTDCGIVKVVKPVQPEKA